MKKEEIQELFVQGIDCSQVVACYFADEMGCLWSRQGKSLHASEAA